MERLRAQLAGALLIVVMAVGLGVEASHLPRAATIHPAPPATPFPVSYHACQPGDRIADNTGVTQAADGSFHACLRVGALAPGTYRITAQRLGSLKAPTLGSTNPRTSSITLTPSSGGPGTVVTVRGDLPAVVPGQRPLDDHTQLCWAACNGPVDFVPITWSTTDPGHFTAEFTVPAAPWFQGDAVASLRPGRYAVIFPCLTTFDKPSGGCSGTALESTFNVTGPASNMCVTPGTCSALQATPGQGPPGTIVAVDGWAPLTGLNGDGFLDIGFDDGQPHGKPGLVNTAPPLVASTPFIVTPAPGWASLPALHPVSIQRTGMDPLGVDPTNPNRFAYCSGSAIEVSANGGQSWLRIPLTGVQTASARTNYPIPSGYGPSSPTCSAVFVDARYPGSFYAVFSTVARNSSPPPFYFVGYLTLNDGRTWQPVPVPSSSDMGLFGGFRTDRTSVQALFWKSQDAMASPDQAAFVAEETLDGGRTWHAGSLRCPAIAPCIALGPQDNARCMAIGEWQAIEISHDAGRSWVTPSWPSRLSACSTSELIGSSDGRIAVLDGFSLYPVTISIDGGATWRAVGVPPLPDGTTDLMNGQWMLGMLPDGRLLLSGPSWYLLGVGATQWCAIPGAPAAASGSISEAPRVIGGRLWWTESTWNSAQQLVSAAKSLPLSGIHC